MTKYRIPIYRPVLGRAEAEELVDCVKRSWLTGGEKVKEFEKQIAELCQVKHAVACSNGTVALYMALTALGIGKGDEVIVPDFTFIACANSVVWTGATPVFCDVDRATMDTDAKKLEKIITNRTKAIMPVHIYGYPCPMDSIMGLARTRGLRVIEDACQGVNVYYKGKHVGGFGDVGCLSFYADKTLTTGEGGMVLTNDDEIARKCLILKHQGRTGRGWYVHDEIGFNFRLTDMQAGVGLAQLRKLKWIVQAKKSHEKQYSELLSRIEQVQMPYRFPRDKVVCKPNLLNIPFRHNIMVLDPDKLIAHLAAGGIEAKRVFFPLHKQPCYKYLELTDTGFSNSVWLYKHGVSLPSSPLLSEAEIMEVCDSIKEFFGKGA